ncbi:hypothetical protein CA85_05010 [Allorhodopirellula solitaria]|uniref:Uncharacterized protein n=1 Tax=Allorhodopirellula solitaria TaxID=2527987 RepID=A0A5C5YK31_9BACT|nr:hypothetical protein CA85_05010 [Allorhodopirellula solitaria]
MQRNQCARKVSAAARVKSEGGELETQAAASDPSTDGSGHVHLQVCGRDAQSGGELSEQRLGATVASTQIAFDKLSVFPQVRLAKKHDLACPGTGSPAETV